VFFAAFVIALVALDRLPVTRDQMLFAGVAVALVAIVGFLQADLIRPYVQSLRIVIGNAVLWVMFFATMATSVFFSFDSLFSTHPSTEDRVARLLAMS